MLKSYVVYVKYEVEALNKLDAENIIYQHVKETGPQHIMASRKLTKEERE